MGDVDVAFPVSSSPQPTPQVYDTFPDQGSNSSGERRINQTNVPDRRGTVRELMLR